MFSQNTLNNVSAHDLDIFEGMTSISAVINSINSGANNRTVMRVLYDKDKSDKRSRELSFLKIMSERLSFEIVATDSSELDNLVSGTTHGGFVALCTKRTLNSLAQLDVIPDKPYFFVLLEGIEDPYNFGYSVRSIYASGADGIVLPPRNWLELSSTVARSSAGSSELADIYVSDPVEAVNFFKNKGFSIVCAGIRDSVSVYDADFTKPTLLIVGGEKRGISRKLLDMCDVTVRIDYGREFKGSLPTASAVAVIAFEAAKQRQKTYDFV